MSGGQGAYFAAAADYVDPAATSDFFDIADVLVLALLPNVNDPPKSNHTGRVSNTKISSMHP